LAKISVIIPALNAAHCISRALDSVAQAPAVLERLVVDGGSDDDTVTIAEAAGAGIVRAPKGRGTQLAAGASAARGDWLLFLHAYTVLAPGWVKEAMAFIENNGDGHRVAAFRFALDHRSSAARRLEALVAWRCRAMGLPYGDQGLLMSRAFYEEIGGYKQIPLFEDVDIIRRIGRRRLDLLDSCAVTSAVRFRRSGFLARSLRNLFCLALFQLGVPPNRIVPLYGGRR
jgi:rSAM/selenodomain-associated transferase 2